MRRYGLPRPQKNKLFYKNYFRSTGALFKFSGPSIVDRGVPGLS